MSKEEATTKKTEGKEAGATAKKTEAKESGATSTVSYRDIQKKRRLKIVIFIIVPVVILAAGILALILTLMKVPDPRFMLDDVSLDPVSGSKVLVTV